MGKAHRTDPIDTLLSTVTVVLALETVVVAGNASNQFLSSFTKILVAIEIG